MKLQSTVIEVQQVHWTPLIWFCHFVPHLWIDKFNYFLFIYRVFRNSILLKSSKLYVSMVLPSLNILIIHTDSEQVATRKSRGVDSETSHSFTDELDGFAGQQLGFQSSSTKNQAFAHSDTGQLRETAVYYHAWISLIQSQLNCQIFVVWSL